MTRELLVYWNGNYLPASQASLSLDDMGFIQGVVITDRLRTFRNKLFRLDDHLRRFRQSCELALVPQPRSDSELAAAANELIEANVARLGSASDWSLVVFATPGAGEPTLGMQARPIDFERYRGLFIDGAILTPVAVPTGFPPFDPRIKHRSRLPWWIAQHSSGAKPPVADILLTTAGSSPCVRETPNANFLAEFDGKLVSPPRLEILNGVSLQIVEELCPHLGIAFEEREIPQNEVLARGGECLLTNSSFCVAPVSKLAGETKPMNGHIFQQLIKSWSDLVGVDIQKQFLT